MGKREDDNRNFLVSYSFQFNKKKSKKKIKYSKTCFKTI